MIKRIFLYSWIFPIVYTELQKYLYFKFFNYNVQNCYCCAANERNNTLIWFFAVQKAPVELKIETFSYMPHIGKLFYEYNQSAASAITDKTLN